MREEDELIRNIRSGNLAAATRSFERLTRKEMPRGAFPFEVGETLYLQLPEWHYLGVIYEVDAYARWVRLYPCVEILETDNTRRLYLKGLQDDPDLCEGDEEEDQFQISPVPVTIQLKEWAAAPFYGEVPTVDYLPEIAVLKKEWGKA
jgi:hypothetical protein